MVFRTGKHGKVYHHDPTNTFQTRNSSGERVIITQKDIDKSERERIRNLNVFLKENGLTKNDIKQPKKRIISLDEAKLKIALEQKANRESKVKKEKTPEKNTTYTNFSNYKL